ncbi:ABC transporter ATP-binding protein [Candidatus Saganbacteria bacterium]|nr:ABC transporter ATP-binding protein [Candidatus Saganbacteria bacterium]
MKMSGKSIETIKYFISKKWRAMVVILILSFLVAFFESLSAVVVYPVLSVLVPETAVEAGAGQFIAIMNLITHNSFFSPLVTVVLILFSLTLLKLSLSYFNTVFSGLYAGRIFQETQIKMMSVLLNSDYQFLINTKKGDLVFRLTTAPGYVSKVIGMLTLMLVELLKTAMMLIVLFVVSPVVTVILLAASSIYYFVTKSIAQRVSYGTGSGRAVSASNQTIHAMNALKGIKSIRLFGVVSHWIEMFSRECMNFYHYALKDLVISSLPASLLELVYISFLCVMVVYFSNVKGGVLGSLPMIGVFVYSLLKIMPSLRLLSSYGMGLMAILPNAEAAYLAIREAEEHRDHLGGNRQLKKFTSEIEIREVTFNYQNAKKPAVIDVSFTVKRGEFIGIIGSSGSGKTTLLDLLSGLLNPTSGRILIDGIPIVDYLPASLCEHIGYVGQETFFFNDTIRNNILFGRAGFDEKNVKEALKKADILDFILGLQGGLDFILADDGMKISGGQRQRLSIARALLRNPEIILLDEATSALDHLAEENVMETILKLVREEGKTVIFVTHRKSAIKDANRVVEMRDGRIIDIIVREPIREMIQKVRIYNE